MVTTAPPSWDCFSGRDIQDSREFEHPFRAGSSRFLSNLGAGGGGGGVWEKQANSKENFYFIVVDLRQSVGKR